MSTTMMPQSAEAQTTPRAELGHLDLSRIAQDLQIRKLQVEAVVHLLDEGNTIPFITRYRKERTGGLDEEVLRTIRDRVNNLRALADRKQTILRTIDSQGKLTDELRAAILAADNPKRLEDLYLPYKPKKRSLAQAAREKGLDRLATAIWEADPVASDLHGLLPTLINPEQGLNNEEDILQGVGHILAEMIAEAADVRAIVRQVMWDTGKLCTTKSEKLAEGQGQEYRDYFDFTEPLRQIPPHRVLAINRGEKDNSLTVKIEWDSALGHRVALERLPLPKKKVEGSTSSESTSEGEPSPPPPPPPRGHRGQQPFVSRLEDLRNHPHREFIERCAEDALNRLLVPSLEREIRRELTQRAENHAVVVFARNLRSKLLAAPLRGKRVLAIDPAFRTGCKLAALNEQGDLIADAVIFPHPPQNKRDEAKAKLEEIIRRTQVHVIAIGNGTACRETEELVSELLAEFENRRSNPQGATSVPNPPVEQPVSTDSASQSFVAAPTTPSSESASSEAVAVPTPTNEPLPSADTSPQDISPQEQQVAAPGAEAATELATSEGVNSNSEPAPPPAEVASSETPAAVETSAAPPPPPAEPLSEPLPELAYVIVNEAGASVYSASSIGREEFPNFDATLRGTISIGRRLQDPLSELVKIDPQHVGVGLYQHDVNPKHLRESLDAVIESCVNTVGVDLNTASVPLLRHVSGLNALVAQRIVEWRKANGPFRRREQLLEIQGIGERTFEQAAGFLKIQGGDEPLDGTWIHPESYNIARQLLSEMNYDPSVLESREQVGELREKLKAISPEEVAARLQVGVPTLCDILDSLARPGRDPREDLPPPVFKKGILKLEDLQPGMELKGTVLNVVDFGAFIDIGLKDSGLVHISQMANRYVKSPYDVVSVGDVVQVWVMSVDNQRHRVSLTMIPPGTERRPPERRSPPPRREAREGGPQREGAPPREGPPQQRQGGSQDRREGRPPRGEPRSAPPGQSGRPPHEGAGVGREGGGRPPRGGQRRENDRGGLPAKRSSLPPRGTSRIGSGANPPGRSGPQNRKATQAGGQTDTAAQAVEATNQEATPKPQAVPKKPRKPVPKLSQAALTGKEHLSSFSELAALLRARLETSAKEAVVENDEAPPTEEASAEQPAPPSDEASSAQE